VRIARDRLGLIDRIEFTPATVVPGQLNEEYSQINPVKKLPALILDNGEVIVDSYVIVEYLDELASAESSFRRPVPSDGRSRATIRCCRHARFRCCCAAMRGWSARRAAVAGVVRRSLEPGVERHGAVEKQADMLSRPLDISQIALVCVLGYAVPVFRLRLAQGLSEARCVPRKNADAALGQDLAAAAGVTSD